jgi:hypothetical protein
MWRELWRVRGAGVWLLLLALLGILGLLVLLSRRITLA